MDLGHRPFATDREALKLCREFRELRLPKPAWTHRAHLTAALWFFTHHSWEETAVLIPAAIKRYNAVTGVEDSATNGYHQTITRFYLWAVVRWMRERPVTDGFAARANALYDELGDRELPLPYYSRERLWSVEARAGWVEPDLVPLPD